MALRVRILTVALLAAAAALAAWLLIRRPAGDLIVRAEFTDARGLVGGNDVRINGAPAGTVTTLTLTKRGTALVTMQLEAGLPAALHPRADATAAIRPVDLLGDNYVALDPGTAAAPLRGAIPASRTLNAPRLSDLLSVFREPERVGLQALLVELGKSLDERGVDLNQAVLQLRPALAAADAVTGELSSQNADLRSVIADSEAVTAQAAERNAELARSVSDLNQFAQTTAAHLHGLDSGLATLPTTVRELTITGADLRETATRAEPLAATLDQAAPALATAAQRLPDFLDATAAAAHQLHPTLRAAASVLERVDPTVYALASGLGAIPPISAPLASVAQSLALAAPSIAQGFFVNFPDQATEPGNQLLDPFANPLRDYWRGAGVLSCESFGVPIAPGCLTSWLAGLLPHERSAAARAASRPAVPQAPAGSRELIASVARPRSPLQGPRAAPSQSPHGPERQPGQPLPSPLSTLLSYLTGP